MTWGIHDVDRGPLPIDRSVFGHDGDAFFALEIIAVHNTFLDSLIGTEQTRLMQHPINECSLAMINVRNDGQVAQIFASSYRHKYSRDSCIIVSIRMIRLMVPAKPPPL
ncbi:hypothetical protein BMS3Bbin04_01114 [bacterium BMS3Bbin04]|nr:hypothetical protein BMS3Bbin04_01114 [bacterium BMS3Bbin04]